MRVRTGWAVLIALMLLLLAESAEAFCGFFVTGGGQVTSDASQVALMRHGTRTVLSMRNSYGGPPEDFALVVPVPVVLEAGQVRTLSPQAFDHLDRLTSPRLVEYWEQDPCPYEIELEEDADNKEGGTGTRAKGEEGKMGNPEPPPVRIEASYSVDEYDIVILSADDSGALEVWLKDNGYKMPDGIEPYLRPYVVAGSKFFVAKVDVKRVKFLWGSAVLSPLRVHYDSDPFSLPIRLGLANADGPQDLLVYVLSPGTRYEVANYDNVLSPTNLEVNDDVRRQFPAFYASLFDRTVAGKPLAVVTEYAWDAASCDPCPVPPLDEAALSDLGADVLPKEQRPSGFVVTRLHARYSKDTAGDDLVFRRAEPIAGGREGFGDGQTAAPSDTNSFQSRYIIRHAWKGSVDCDEPIFGQWGGPPSSETPRPPSQLSARARRDLPLDTLILSAAQTGEGQPHAPGARRPRNEPSWLERTWRKTNRFMTDNDSIWLSILFFPIGLLLVVAFARRRAKSALWHGALYAVVAGSAGSLLSFRRGQVHFDAEYWPAVLLAHVTAACAVLVWVVRQREGRSVVAWLPPLLAMAPLAAGVAAYRAELGLTLEYLHEATPDMGPRILASGEAGALLIIVLGACGSALLLAAASTGLVRATEDTSESKARGVGLAALVGLLGLVAVQWPWKDVDDEAWPMLLLPLLWLAATSLSWRMRKWPKAPDEGRAHGATVATLALWLWTAGALAGVAVVASTFSHGMDAATSWSVDPSQKAHIIGTTLDRTQEATWKSALAVLLSLAPVWVLVVRSWRRGDLGLDLREARRMVAPVVVLFVLGLTYASARGAFMESHQPVAIEEDRLGSVAELNLAPLSSEYELARMGSAFAGPALFVDASGELQGSATSNQPPKPWTDALYAELGEGANEPEALPEPLLLADRGLRVRQLQAALDPLLSRQQPWFRWVFGVSKLGERAEALGVYADLVTDAVPRRTLDVEWLPELEVTVEDVPEDAAGAVVALRSRDGQFEAVRLYGAHGRYRRRADPEVKRFDTSNDAGTIVHIPFVEVRRAAELVIVVSPDATVAELAALMLATVTSQRRNWGMGATPVMRRYVLSTDDAPFRR